MNEGKKVEEKTILEIIILIVSLFLLIMGVSFAMYKFHFTGSSSSINTTSVGIEFLESKQNIIDIKNATPMTDEEGINQDDEFVFAVKTKTTRTTDIKYILYIEKLEQDDGYTPLEDNYIKVYLKDYNEKKLINPTLVSNLNNYALYSKSNSHNKTNEVIQDKYKLRVWIDESKTNEAKTWNKNTKLEYKFKIKVELTEPNN